MIQPHPERFIRSSGRSRGESSVDDYPALRPTSRFRLLDDEDVVSGGLRHAAGIWQGVAAKRRQSARATADKLRKTERVRQEGF
jgi:hypothetical protein